MQTDERPPLSSEEFVGWLRAHNDALPADVPKVGFYGLDLYSLHASVEAVIDEMHDTKAAHVARQNGPSQTTQSHARGVREHHSRRFAPRVSGSRLVSRSLEISSTGE